MIRKAPLGVPEADPAPLDPSQGPVGSVASAGSAGRYPRSGRHAAEQGPLSSYSPLSPLPSYRNSRRMARPSRTAWPSAALIAGALRRLAPAPLVSCCPTCGATRRRAGLADDNTGLFPAMVFLGGTFCRSRGSARAALGLSARLGWSAGPVDRSSGLRAGVGFAGGRARRGDAGGAGGRRAREVPPPGRRPGGGDPGAGRGGSMSRRRSPSTAARPARTSCTP